MDRFPENNRTRLPDIWFGNFHPRARLTLLVDPNCDATDSQNVSRTDALLEFRRNRNASTFRDTDVRLYMGKPFASLVMDFLVNGCDRETPSRTETGGVETVASKRENISAVLARLFHDRIISTPARFLTPEKVREAVA